jgi:hypothetical protein
MRKLVGQIGKFLQGLFSMLKRTVHFANYREGYAGLVDLHLLQ